jgi:hypothetical protein
MSTEPQLLPSPPLSPTPSDTSTERGRELTSKAYVTSEASTVNKGKGRMVESPIDSQESDQEHENDEYPPDEAETKRIEEVSRGRMYL